MRIYSCRRRSEWRYPFTIRYGGAYFQVIDEKFIDAGPRPYAYSLRRLPPGKSREGWRNMILKMFWFPSTALNHLLENGY